MRERSGDGGRIAALRWDVGRHAQERSSSAGLWESVLVRELAYAPVGGGLTTAAVGDVCLTLVVSGAADLRSRPAGAGWETARDHRGKLAVTAPWTETSWEWQGEAGPLVRVHTYVPEATLALAAEGLGGGSRARLPLPSTAAAVDPLLERVVLDLRRAARAGAPEFYAESAAQLIAARLLLRAGTATDRQPLRAPAAVVRARAVLHERLGEPVTLRAVADEVGLSPFHLARTFRASLGVTPLQYLTDLRVSEARRLLADPALSVTRVGEACGFGTPSYFAAVFRRTVGVSPSEYRRSLAGPRDRPDPAGGRDAPEPADDHTSTLGTAGRHRPS